MVFGQVSGVPGRLCTVRIRAAATVLLFSILLTGTIALQIPPVPGQASPKPRILFDESHAPMVWTISDSKVSLTIEDGFSSLATALTSVGFEVSSLKTAPISPSQLDGVSVLVVPPSTGHLSSSEESIVLDFVRKGGGLLLFGENSYGGQASLAGRFGVTPVMAVVCDPVYSLPIRPFHIRIWRMVSHEITKDVGSYIFDWGQPLVVKSPALALAYVGNQSWIETDYDGKRQSGEKGGGDIAVLAATEYGSGRVVFTGDTGGFMNYDVIGWSGLDQFDTRRLALNIFNWLGRQELFGVNLSYLVSMDLDGAGRHTAHVKVTVERLGASDVNLTMYRWHDWQYYQMPVTGFSAHDPSGSALPDEFKFDGLRRFWTVQVGQVTSLTVEYDVILDFIRNDFDQYAGYLSRTFGVSEGAGIFVIPQDTPVASFSVRFSVPQGWGVFTSWKETDGATFVPENTESLMWSTFAVGTFSESSMPIGDTNVRIVTYGGWDAHTQQVLADYSFRAYDYVTKVFGRSVPLETYLAVWVPNAEDGRGICELEWSNSQGIVTSPSPNINYNEYVHRVFHTWNAFEPTGIAMNSNEEDWFVEGTNTYYDDKAVVQLGIKDELSTMAYYLKEYLTEYVGTQFDVPLTEAYKHANSGNFNKYNWLYYHKGALVSYLLDETIMGVTSGKKSLDDLLKGVYATYGGFNGAVSNADLVRMLSSITGFDFNVFFIRFVYGTDKLPLKAMGNGLTVDWADLNAKLELAKTTISAATSRTSYTVTSVISHTTSSVIASPQTITETLETGTTASQTSAVMLSTETLELAVVVLVLVSLGAILHLARSKRKRMVAP
jgi:predicted metalloprotease with PDZ domain